MEDLVQFILERRSCRKYTDEMVSDEQIQKVMDAGIYAASAGNLQPVIILAITNKQVRDKLSKANAQVMGSGRDPFYGAPVVLVVLGNKEMKNRVYDGSLALGNMMLAASALGLGSCWIHRAREEFEQPQWQEFLKEQGISDSWEGIGHLILGHPAKGAYDAPRSGRKGQREYWVR